MGKTNRIYGALPDMHLACGSVLPDIAGVEILGHILLLFLSCAPLAMTGDSAVFNPANAELPK